MCETCGADVTQVSSSALDAEAKPFGHWSSNIMLKTNSLKMHLMQKQNPKRFEVRKAKKEGRWL